MSQSPPPVTRISPQQGVGVFDLAEVWRYRALLEQNIRRQLTLRLFHTPLSVLWGFLRPGIMTAAMIFIRHATGADFGQGVPYEVFVFSGLCLWFLFTDTTSQIAGSLAADASVIQRVYYPRIIGPLGMVLSRFVDAAIIVAAIIIFQLIVGVAMDWEIVLLLPAIITLLVLAFGVGSVFAALILYNPDTRKALDITLYLGLFLSPIIFAPAIIPEYARVWYNINPIVGVLSAARGSLFAPMPIDYLAWGMAALIAVAAALIGLWMLSRAARVVGERL
jgi:lipopolysaccharide transport system permease protein